MFPSPEPEPSSARKSPFFQARAELSLEIQNYFEPKPSHDRILILSQSRAEPAQLELFGSSHFGTLWEVIAEDLLRREVEEENTC